jgi:hypothetical protein
VGRRIFLDDGKDERIGVSRSHETGFHFLLPVRKRATRLCQSRGVRYVVCIRLGVNVHTVAAEEFANNFYSALASENSLQKAFRGTRFTAWETTGRFDVNNSSVNCCCRI